MLDVLADPSFYRDLELPDVELRDVVAHDDDGNRGSVVLRYEYVGQLDPIVVRMLGGRRLTWLQTLAVDRQTATGRLDFAVETSPERLRGVVDFDFVADGAETLRRLEGEVKVNVPLIGGQAERRLVPGVLRRLDVEAEHVADRLA